MGPPQVHSYKDLWEHGRVTLSGCISLLCCKADVRSLQYVKRMWGFCKSQLGNSCFSILEMTCAWNFMGTILKSSWVHSLGDLLYNMWLQLALGDKQITGQNSIIKRSRMYQESILFCPKLTKKYHGYEPWVKQVKSSFRYIERYISSTLLLCIVGLELHSEPTIMTNT